MKDGKRPYRSPELTRFGRVSELTAGGTGVMVENVMVMIMMMMVTVTGCDLTRDPPPGDPCNTLP